jgi:tetratricopeptide (TPR) repeat protein
MITEFQPYVGPRAYERDDLAPFFGRDHESDELLSLVISSRELLFYAQSGTGKTSLLNARVIPLLEQERFEVLPVARVQGVPPRDLETAEIHNIYIFNTLMSWTKDEVDPRGLVHMTLAEFLKERKRPTDARGKPCPRAIIFDQFEELFALYADRWRDRKGFFEQVCDALEEDRRLRMVFSLREDYIAQLDPFASIMPEEMRTRFRLERLRRETALEAITGPLRSTKCSFAPGVAEKLVEDLQKTRIETVTSETIEVIGEFVEPVQLQVVCQNLWQELPPDATQITEEHLMALGSLDYPLAKFYETAITAAAAQTGIDEGELRQWCEQWLIITPTGIRGIVHRGLKSTEGMPNEALDILEDRHLIRCEWRAGARWYELTHDRIVAPILASNKRWKEQREEKVKNALLLLRQAEQANTINKYEQALDYAEKAYLICEEIGDESGKVSAILSRGKAYEGQKRYEEAKTTYMETCKLFHEAGDHQREATMLQAIGDVERIHAEQAIKSDRKEARAEQDTALKSYEQARKLFHEIVDSSGEARVLLAIGNVQQSRAEQAAALKSYGQALELFQKVGDTKGVDNVQQAKKNIQLRKSRNSLLLALLFIFILGSSGLLYYIVIIQPAQVQAQRRAAVANATAAVANAHATATGVAVGATAIVVAQHNDPYTLGTLILYDPLSRTVNWYPDSDPSFGSSCQFMSGGYYITESQRNSFYYCYDVSQSFANFAFEVKMTINQGDCGGMVLRYDPHTGKGYVFFVCSDGTWQFDRYTGFSANSSTVLKSGDNSGIHSGQNTIAMVARGGNFAFYLDNTYTQLDSVSDSTFSQGYIGLIANDNTNTTRVEYSDAAVWTAP